MSTKLKVICYGALLGVWGFFAYNGKTEVSGFIEAIGAALAALGAIHAVGAKPAASQEDPAAKQ